jgi:hypothetical protein
MTSLRVSRFMSAGDYRRTQDAIVRIFLQMKDTWGYLLCDACASRIGVYERFQWLAPDGRLLDSTEVDPNAPLIFAPLHGACAASRGPGHLSTAPAHY